MSKTSAGLLVYRRRGAVVEVLLVHPGGPFWRNRDLEAWSIPKGEYEAGEEPETAALREFAEELGCLPAVGAMLPLGEVVQKSGKSVIAFAVEGDLDVTEVESNTFELEWPPRSGRRRTFPEVDRAEWFPLAVAREKIIPGQRPLLDRLEILAGA